VSPIDALRAWADAGSERRAALDYFPEAELAALRWRVSLFDGVHPAYFRGATPEEAVREAMRSDFVARHRSGD